jgi:hypothetical protein
VFFGSIAHAEFFFGGPSALSGAKAARTRRSPPRPRLATDRELHVGLVRSLMANTFQRRLVSMMSKDYSNLHRQPGEKVVIGAYYGTECMFLR